MAGAHREGHRESKHRFAYADADTKNAFNGVPVKVLLPVRTELYKRTDRPLVSGPRISPWWCFVEDFTLPDGNVITFDAQVYNVFDWVNRTYSGWTGTADHDSA